MTGPLARSADDVCHEALDAMRRELDNARDEADRYRLAPYGDTFRFEALEKALAERDEARADAARIAAVLLINDGVGASDEWLTEMNAAMDAHDALVAKR